MEATEARRGYARVAAWDEGNLIQAMARLKNPTIALLLKTEHMGKPWNNESAEKWWACGRHVRQKELAPSAKVRRTTPEVVRAPPRHLLVRRRCCASKRACAVTQSCRASIVRRTATTRRPARPLGRRRCSEPRSRSQPAGRYALAVSSEGALRLRCSASSVACASEFKPLYRRKSVREREPRERGQGFRVPVCACAGIGVYARVLGPTQLS